MESKMDATRIFRYVLEDAWHRTISQLDVINLGSSGEARGIFFNKIMPAGKVTSVDSQLTKLSEFDIDAIKKIIRSHIEMFDYEKIESHIVLDGVINRFEFSMDEERKEFSSYNIWGFQDRIKEDTYREPPVKAWNVLDTFEEIGDILKTRGVDEKYLRLQ